MNSFHEIMDMLRLIQTCHDCGARLKFREIRRCKKCKLEYEIEKNREKLRKIEKNREK